MPLDEKWTNNSTGPFRDNSLGEITASDLRDFAGEVADEAIPADWYQIDTGDIDEGFYTFTSVGTSVDLGMSALGGGSVVGSSEWAHALSEPLVSSYTPATLSRYFLYVSFFGQDGLTCDVDFNNASTNLQVVPIITFGDSAAFDGTTEIRTAGRSAVYTGTPVDLTGTQLLTFPSTSLPFVKISLRLNPAVGSAVEDGGTFSIVDDNIRVLVVARPAAEEIV